MKRAQKKKRSSARKLERASAGSFDLGALFGTTSGRFLEKHWPDKPCVFHHPDEHAPEIWHLPDLESLDQALNVAAPETLFANLPDYDEEYSQILLSNAADAKKAFACKMSLSLEPDLTKVTDLLFWLRSIRRDLGLAEQTYGRCLVYASPDGGRTAAHYDQNINIVCQLSGEKIWHLAPNTHVVNPQMRYTIGTPADRSTAAVARKALPKEMPREGRIRVVLKRGSVLFVPRGYWHETSAKGESLSLNFTYDQPSWAQVLSAAISRKLLKDEKWRGVAYGLRQEGPLRSRAEAEFEALWRNGAGVPGNLRFDDLT